MRGKRESNELPKWPRIDAPRSNELRVHGKHITYPRLILAERISSLLSLALFGGVIYLFFIGNYEAIRTQSVEARIAQCFVTIFAGALVLTILPIARMLCRLLFPRKTSVRFKADAIFVGWKRFDLFPDSEIQFRASRPHLSDEKYVEIHAKMRTREAVKNGAYKLQFRKVEMVYGSRLIHITSVANEDRAEQFIMMLQSAYKQTRPGIAEKPAPLPEIENEEFEDMLPE